MDKHCKDSKFNFHAPFLKQTKAKQGTKKDDNMESRDRQN